MMKQDEAKENIKVEEIDESKSSIQQVQFNPDVEQESKKGKRTLKDIVSNLKLIRLMKKYPKTSAVILVLMVGIAKEAYIHFNSNKNLIPNIDGVTNYSSIDSEGMMESQIDEEQPLEEVDNNIYFHEDEYEVDFTIDKIKKMLREKDCKILCDYNDYTYADGSRIEFQDEYSVFKGLGGFICPMSNDDEEISRYNQGYVVWKSYDKVDRVILHDGTLIQWYQISDEENNDMNLYRYITSDGLTCNVRVTPKGPAISFETADDKTMLPLDGAGFCRTDWLNEKGEKIGYKEYGTHYVTWYDLEGREVYCEGISREFAEKTEYKDDGTEIVTNMIDGTVRTDKDGINYSRFDYANGRSAKVLYDVDHPYAIILYDANGVEIANRGISRSRWVIIDGSNIEVTDNNSETVEIISYGKYDTNFVDGKQYFGKVIPGTDDYDVGFTFSSDEEFQKN